MGIRTELDRIKNAKTALKTAIEGKGVTVPAATLLDGYAALVASIDSGLDTSDATAVAGDILYDKTAYVNGAKLTGTGRLSPWMRAYYTPHTVLPSGFTVSLPVRMYQDATDLITMDTNQAGGFSTHVFLGCSSMTGVVCPRVTEYGTQVFGGCTSLASAVLGGIGYPVTTISANSFSGCTQAGLTITVYVTPGSQPLAEAPWGATNATIVYRSAVDGGVL